MLRALRLIAFVCLLTRIASVDAQTVATMVDGRAWFPVEIESSYFLVSLETVSTTNNVYRINMRTGQPIDAPDEDTAVYLPGEGALYMPSLATGDSLLTDLTFSVLDRQESLFKLDEFKGRPSVIFFNGEVITMEDRQPDAEALAIAGDTIIAVGTNERVMAMRGPNTQLINLYGRTLMPGFVDPHNHTYHSVFFGRSPEWETYADAQQALLAAGTTTMGDANVWSDLLDDFRPFAESDELRIRTSVYLGYNDNCGELWPADWWKAYEPTRNPRARFRVLGIKIFADGGSCNRGAFLFSRENGDLYFTDKEKEPWSNELGWLPEAAIADAAAHIETALRDAADSGYQAVIHALGDIAIDTALLAVENALDGGENTPRFRIEHNRFIRPGQLSRYGEVGAIPVVFGQPYTCPILYDGPWSGLQNVPIFQPWLDPWRALLDANPGLPIAWKSDSVGGFPLEPITHLWSLVTRNEYGYVRDTPGVPTYVSPPPEVLCEAPEWLKANAVTVDEALRMMTVNAAYALFMEKKVGSLRPGKFADMIVLSENPRTVDPSSIVDIDVQVTMIGGQVEHCAIGSEALCP